MSINRPGEASIFPKGDIARIVNDSRYTEDYLVRAEGFPFNYPTIAPGAGGAIVVVEVTETESQGYYTGKFTFLNPLPLVPTWNYQDDPNGDAFDCKCRDVNDEDLEVGKRYIGRVMAQGETGFGCPFPDWTFVSVQVGGGSVNPGCGLLERTYNTVVYLEVDYVQLAGNTNTTSLIGTATNSNTNTCGWLAFDKTPVTNTNEVLVTNTSIGMINGVLAFSMTQVTYRNFFNAAGVHVDRQPVANSTVVTTTELDTCLFADCCNTTNTVTASAAADFTDINPGDTVTFTGTGGGGTAPLSYHWDFDDGGTSNLQNPTHVFAAAGTYDVVLTVTDACGWSATDIVTITVHAPVTVDCCEDPVEGVLYAEISGSTGTCSLDGEQFTVVYNAGVWTASVILDAFAQNTSFTLSCVGGNWTMASYTSKTLCDVSAVTDTSPCTDTLATFTITMTDCCVGTFVLTLTRTQP